MNDDEFLQQLFNLSLSPDNFNHQGHLRLAWLVAGGNPLPKAIEIVCQAIKAYATALGASEKFHRTITQALTTIIYIRQEQQQYDSFDLFLQNNQDLTNHAINLLKEHYSQSLLESKKSRQHWFAPDKRAFE